jgi:hypothetical protein
MWTVRWNVVGIALYVIGLFFVLFVAARGAAGGHTPRLRMLGWASASIAIILLIVAAHRWVKVFPGILLYATLNAAHSISSGHSTNHPESPIPWRSAVVLTMLFAAITVAFLTFSKRELDRVDRIALLAFLSFFAWATASQRATFVALSLAFCSLLIAWSTIDFNGTMDTIGAPFPRMIEDKIQAPQNDSQVVLPSSRALAVPHSARSMRNP